ncbi:ABC transporter substrate-binding protein [Cohnella zeiphila]|uniref:Extracellular solute-binding protein n=1 Tax=Cohnella zeiphila TaxID=2761120 RepID=A0A7X0STF1_9BACL|nr:extracellular solute-binding protein [Cohnella zeiphila]MBB6735671.1 extracellular solute-binding protein [Cohnella zeiphila]
MPLAAVTMFALLVSGCGGNGNNAGNSASPSGSPSGSSGGSTASSTASASAAPGSAVDGKGKTLTLWTWKVAYTPGFEAAAKLYQEKTGAKVEIQTFTPDDTYRQKFQAAANSGNLPDVVNWWATAGDSIEGSIVDLSTVFGDDVLGSYYKTAMDPIRVTQQQVDSWASDKNATELQKSLKAGQFYGLPLDIGGFFTFYGNKQLMEKAGVSTDAPKTWEDFIAEMKTIKEKTGTPGLVLGGQVVDLWENWAGSALSIMLNGPEGYNALMERKAKMSDPANLPIVKAAEALSDNDLLMPGVLSTSIDGADQAFAAGKAAFDLGGSFTMSSLLAMGMNPDDIVSFPVPPISGSKITQWTTDPFTLTMLSVNKDSKNKDLALDFIKFVTTDPDAAVAFANGAYTIPALNLEGKSADLQPTLKSISDSFATEPGPYSQSQADINTYRGKNKEWEVYAQAIQSMWEKKMDAAAVAKKFDDTMASLEASGN